ncbi:MAG: 50S rRNA methyltransferase [Gammaproteobacteria bacterium]|nr:MAG: 50S rRNA methyltransferase [Gammaproteobacteria bacterium]
MHVAQGQFQILRFPIEKNEKLQAWGAADEYLLQDVAKKIGLEDQPSVLIINDSFGALAVALSAYKPSVVSDSFISQAATRKNLALNQIDLTTVRLFDSLVLPQDKFDFILIKAPKTLAFLEDMLIRLQDNLTVNTQVIVSGMVKHLPASVWQLMARYIGVTAPSKAVKKARLIYAQVDIDRVVPINPYPVYYPLENTQYQICNHANIFSHKSLDIGTRFFLEHLPQDDKYQQVVDLGCGNGVVGLIFSEKNPNAQLHFVDESFMAVASAEENFKQALTTVSASFQAGDALTDFTDKSMDLILCNPPFHQQNTVGGHIALRMFEQSKKVLRPNGELWVIGNRHLGYHASLKKFFSKVEVMVSNAKFVIIKASNS